jgi:hypothetical protein
MSRKQQMKLGIEMKAPNVEMLKDINSSLQHGAINNALKEAGLPAAIIVSRSGRRNLTPVDRFFQKFPDAAAGYDPCHIYRSLRRLALSPAVLHVWFFCMHSRLPRWIKSVPRCNRSV